MSRRFFVLGLITLAFVGIGIQKAAELTTSTTVRRYAQNGYCHLAELFAAAKKRQHMELTAECYAAFNPKELARFYEQKKEEPDLRLVRAMISAGQYDHARQAADKLGGDRSEVYRDALEILQGKEVAVADSFLKPAASSRSKVFRKRVVAEWLLREGLPQGATRMLRGDTGRDALIIKARAAAREGLPELAKQLFDRALQSDPAHLETYSQYIELARAFGDVHLENQLKAQKTLLTRQ